MIFPQGGGYISKTLYFLLVYFFITVHDINPIGEQYKSLLVINAAVLKISTVGTQGANK